VQGALKMANTPPHVSPCMRKKNNDEKRETSHMGCFSKDITIPLQNYSVCKSKSVYSSYRQPFTSYLVKLEIPSVSLIGDTLNKKQFELTPHSYTYGIIPHSCGETHFSH
jgi:hypothetical protein